MDDIVKVTRATWAGGYRVHLAFSDGQEGERDLSDVIAEGGVMVEALADERMFSRLFVQLGTLAWPNGFDLDSIVLHDEMAAAGLLRRRAA